MAAENLADLLTEEELNALKIVTQPKTVENIRLGKETSSEAAAVKVIDDLIDGAAPIKQPITIYKSFENGSLIKDSKILTEKAFLTGSKSASKGNGNDIVTLNITVPVGSKIIELPGGSYIMRRGVTLNLSPGLGHMIMAKVKGSRVTASVGVIMSPTNQRDLELQSTYLNSIEEFYNKAHGRDGRFTSGSGGGGGKASKAAAPGENKVLTAQDREKRLQEREKRLQREQKLQRKVERRRNRQHFINTLLNISAVIAAVGTVVGVLVSSGLVDPDKVKQKINQTKYTYRYNRSKKSFPF